VVIQALRRLYFYDAVGALVVMVGHHFVGAPYKMIPFTIFIVIHLILLGKALHQIELADREATITQTIKTIHTQLNQDVASQHQAHD
jgi:Ca2+/Na+ antiporter